jgi:carboxyl-terminal processing protease
MIVFVSLVPEAIGQTGRRGPHPPERLDRELTEIVRLHFYQGERAATWAKAHAEYGRNIDDLRDFATVTNQFLDELGASHTHYYTPLDLPYYGLLAIYQEILGLDTVEYDGIGVDLTPDHFIRVVFSGGPAEKAGLRRGDRIVAAEGRPFHPVLSVRGRAGKEVALTIQRRRGETEFEVRVTPRTIDPKREWIEARQLGSKLVHRGGKVIGYVPLYCCAGEEPEIALREAFADTFRTADALILDLRDGWGGCNPEFLTLFDRAPPVLTIVGRDGARQRVDSQWRRPVYLLINRGTRSGKEMVAEAIKRRKIGTLIGERTAGAVMAARPFLLSDRSLLYVAVGDVLVDSRRLEGVGTEPDIPVPDVLPFAAGADPLLERALDIASATTALAPAAPGRQGLAQE